MPLDKESRRLAQASGISIEDAARHVADAQRLVSRSTERDNDEGVCLRSEFHAKMLSDEDLCRRSSGRNPSFMDPAYPKPRGAFE